jgi:hypothetical protein
MKIMSTKDIHLALRAYKFKLNEKCYAAKFETVLNLGF